MADILEKIVAVKHDEVATALRRKPLALMRQDAESRLTTRDFEGAMRRKIAVRRPSPTRGCFHVLSGVVPVPVPNFLAGHACSKL